MAKFSPFALADPEKPEARVWYNAVPVPRSAEVGQVADALANLAGRAGPVDCTPLIDSDRLPLEPSIMQEPSDPASCLAPLSVCLRFACLAYRRNTAAARSVLSLPHGEGVEIQFRSAGGGHAVCYLYQGDAGGLLAVLTFKGSTLSSPGAPGLGLGSREG